MITLKNRAIIFSLLTAIPFVNIIAKEVSPSLPPGVIESPYETCKNVVVVSKDKYQSNEEQWKAFESKCKTKVQVAEEAGLTRLSSLHEGAQYLNLASKVADKVIETLDKSDLYAKCSAACFHGDIVCSAQNSGEEKEIKCSDRKGEILRGLKIQSRKIRMELALSQGASDLENLNVYNVDTMENEKRINVNLRDFEIGTPNPVGRTKLQSSESEHALGIVKRERAKVEEEYRKKVAEGKLSNDPVLRSSWMMSQFDKLREEHQQKYRQLIFEESPLFAVIDRPSQFQYGDEPVWTDEQIASAFLKLSENANKTKAVVKESIAKGQLEFKRDNGEAFGKWLLQLMPGQKDHNDLLYYMGMKNQVEDVLKADKSMCGAATTMAQRLTSKEFQNMGVVFVASFAGAGATKAASKAVTGVFRIGRSLTGAEATGLTGLAIGSSFLGDSFRQYNTSVNEVISGVRDEKDIESAKTNVALNLVFFKSYATGGWVLGKTLYYSLGKKMAKDLPEISGLMKKAGTNEAARDEAVDKWILTKVKSAIKNKFLGKEDEALLKSEAGGKILNQLAEDIQKNNPAFFKDPKNFDFFLKTAATTLKKQPGDPADLGDKARHLFLSFNPEAFQSWDPKARLGLMQVFNEGVEELRSAYTKDPAAYAKFTTDTDSQEKIILAALKRSGAKDEELAAMKTCALKK